jgi:hypothetical protein
MWQSHLIQKGTEPYVMAIIKREFLDMEAKDWLASLCITERNWTLGRKKIDSGHKLTLDVPHVLGWKPTALAWSSKVSSWPSEGSGIEGGTWRGKRGQSARRLLATRRASTRSMSLLSWWRPSHMLLVPHNLHTYFFLPVQRTDIFASPW